MKNVEKYMDVLLKLENSTGIAIVDGEPASCRDTKCSNCDMPGFGCGEGILRWMFSEYNEKPVLAERQYYFLKALPLNSRIKLDSQTNGELQLEIQPIDGKVWLIPGEFFNRIFPSLPIKDDHRWHDVSEMLTMPVGDGSND